MLTHPALLMVDEFRYLPFSQDGAVLFVQLINARHERASTVLKLPKSGMAGPALGPNPRGVTQDVMPKNASLTFHGAHKD